VEVYEAIRKRRTVRDFKEKQISNGVIKKIIAAGLCAPTNNHLRQWEFIVIKGNEAKLRTIAAVSKNLTPEVARRIVDKWGLTDKCQREMYLDGIPKQYRMLLSAGCLIIPCFCQKENLLKSRTLSGLNGFASIWCCIENMLLAAVAEGIFGVTRIPFEKETHYLRKTLKIPRSYAIPCYIALGYPDRSKAKFRQLQIKVQSRIHADCWQDREPPED